LSGRGIPVTAFAAALLATAPSAADTLRGPVAGIVVRAIDGDTLEFVAHVWLGLNLTTDVRVRGIDTPEVRGACAREKDLAAKATRRLSELTAGGVTIANVADDKYFGRVVADVTTSTGTDVKAAMIASGLARPYDGGTRQPWCEVVSAGR
jgi:endonuclease YncB( thermonuclease family)